MKITVTEFVEKMGTNVFKIQYKGRYPRSPKIRTVDSKFEDTPMGNRYVERIYINYEGNLVLVVSDKPIDFDKGNNINQTIHNQRHYMKQYMNYLTNLEKKISKLQ